jgi:hypothetical protein
MSRTLSRENTLCPGSHPGVQAQTDPKRPIRSYARWNRAYFSRPMQYSMELKPGNREGLAFEGNNDTRDGAPSYGAHHLVGAPRVADFLLL